MSEHELWNELGNLYYLSGAYNQAVQAYHRSIQLDGDYGRPYSNLALIYVQQGKYEKAVDLYRKSIDLLLEDKEKAISWSCLGTVYRHLKDYFQAVDAYQRADELDPEGGEQREGPDRLLYGNAAAPVKPAQPGLLIDADDAELPGTEQDQASDQQIIEEEPTSDETEWFSDLLPEAPDLDMLEWSRLQQDLRQSGTQPEQVEAGQSDPQPKPVEGWSHPQRELHTFSQPTPRYKALLTQPAAASQAGQMEISVEEAAPAPEFILMPEEAAEDADTQPVDTDPRPVNEDSTDIESQENRSIEVNKVEVDIARFKRVVQVNPRNAAAWDALGNLYKSSEMYQDAILAYQQALSVDSTKPWYFHHLGLVYAAEGRDEEAIQTFQKVIELDPEHGLAHATLGGYYRKMGLDELAQQHIGKAMRIIFDSENEYNRACLESICGHADQALELLRVALQNKQTYVDWVLRDPDLDFIRSDPRFKKLMEDFAR